MTRRKGRPPSRPKIRRRLARVEGEVEALATRLGVGDPVAEPDLSRLSAEQLAFLDELAGDDDEEGGDLPPCTTAEWLASLTDDELAALEEIVQAL
jgi:hypothetical protein